MELPHTYDFSSTEVGTLLDIGQYTFLHEFFDEEGMALHLRSDADGAEFYVNLPIDMIEESRAHGITGDYLDTSRAGQRVVTLVLQVGEPSASVNIPFVFALNERPDVEELLGLSESDGIGLILLEGVRGELRYHGRLRGRLGDETREVLQEVAPQLLQAL